MRFVILLLYLVLVQSCASNSAQYEYADGNGNQYIITRQSLIYIPIKPEESSTGTYSGGDPKTVRLTAAQFDSIREALEGGVKSNNHIVDRVKMSGVISVVGETDKTKYILTPGSPEIKIIETRLKEIIRN